MNRCQTKNGTEVPSHFLDVARILVCAADRPEFQKIMDSVRAGEIDVVVIYKLDRISRNKRDFWNLVHEFRQYNVTIVTATQFVEMQTSGGRAATGVLMDFAEYEREIDSERINGQIRAARMAGRWASAATPYGYAKTQHAELVVDEEAAKRVRFIFERYLVIKSARQVAIELNERFGDKEPGKPWRTQAFQGALAAVKPEGLCILYLIGSHSVFIGVCARNPMILWLSLIFNPLN